jgi:small glutamine-rich tetratricopeptide repeat-containing protein alpha
MDNNKKVAYQILKFLESQKTEGTVSPEIDSAISSISNTFNVNLSSVEDYSKLNYFSSTLGELIDAGANALGSQTFETSLAEAESNPKYPAFISTVKKTVYFDGVEEGTLPYIERHSKVLQKFKAKLESSKAVKKNDAEAEKEAEVKKAAGNDALQEKDYNAAVRLYTEAIELSPNGPNSHIYYSNRAAAHCYLTSYELAIADCEKSVSLSPAYVKAYTRLGLAHYSMKNFDGAIEAYKKCIELEPKVKSHKDSLTQAKQKALEYKGLSSSGDSFDMGSLADSLGEGGKGGMPPGLAGMMQNPSLMKAAQVKLILSLQHKYIYYSLLIL